MKSDLRRAQGFLRDFRRSEDAESLARLFHKVRVETLSDLVQVYKDSGLYELASKLQQAVEYYKQFEYTE